MIRVYLQSVFVKEMRFKARSSQKMFFLLSYQCEWFIYKRIVLLQYDLNSVDLFGKLWKMRLHIFSDIMIYLPKKTSKSRSGVRRALEVFGEYIFSRSACVSIRQFHLNTKSSREFIHCVLWNISITQYWSKYRVLGEMNWSDEYFREFDLVSITQFDSEHWTLARLFIFQFFSTPSLKIKIKNRAHHLN
jgi:hypothetical protein